MKPCFDKERISDFIRERTNNNIFFKDYSALGVEKDGDLLFGVVYNNYREHDGDIELNIAIGTPRCVTKNTIRMVLDYPFNQLGCVRVTCRCSSDNEKIIKFLDGIGFTREGILRKAFGRKTDTVIFGMLKEECHWLEKD